MTLRRQGTQASDVPISVENAYFSASNFKPLPQLAFTGPDPLDLADCEPFDDHKHRRLPFSPGSPVAVVPFKKSPLGLLAIRERGGRIVQDLSIATANEAHQEGPASQDSIAPLASFDLFNSAVKFFAAYPLYVPVYLSHVRITNLRNQDSGALLPPRDISVVLVGHSSSQAMATWTSKAHIYDEQDLNTEVGSQGWRECTCSLC